MIRRAVPSDMEEVMQLVCDVFEQEQDIPRDMAYIEESRSPIWWVIDSGNQEPDASGTSGSPDRPSPSRISGAIASYESEGNRHLARFVIRKECRGQGLGSKLMQFALEDLFQSGVPIVYTDSRDQTVRILLRLGGVVDGEPYPFYRGNCTPVSVRKEDYHPFE